MGYPFPFLFRHLCVLLGGPDRRFADFVDHGISFRSLRNAHLDLVPHPLPGGREIKVFAVNRIAVQKRYAATRGMTVGSPVPRFEQPGTEHSDLHRLADNTIDLNPVPYS